MSRPIVDEPGEVALRVRSLSRGFAGVAAVQDLGFEVRRGEIFGLVGPDGAGKTSTLRMLAGVMRADAGSIELDGIDVLADPEAAKLHLSYMPQRFGLYEDLSVGENIVFYAELFGVPRSRREARAGELLAAAGLAGFERRLAGTLSGGMKQKLGLVCALIHEPRVLLLDEPTTGVDPVSRRDFWEILYRLRDDGSPSSWPPPTWTKPSAAPGWLCCMPGACACAIPREVSSRPCPARCSA